jgi:murein DD-endopeptidase MepM/ murein hydrolase activator NlpD
MNSFLKSKRENREGAKPAKNLFKELHALRVFAVKVLPLGFFAILFATLLAPPITAQAQSSGLHYIVQTGDTLFNIAQAFGVSLADLQKANSITDPTKIVVGQALTIPGFEGISGKVLTYKVKAGETFSGIARRLGMNYDLAVRLNRVTNPSLLYIGQRITYLDGAKGSPNGRVMAIQPGESIVALAARSGRSIWELAILNDVANPYTVIAGQQLITPADGVPLTGLPAPFNSIVIKPERIIPGGTMEVIVQLGEGADTKGRFHDRDLNFATDAAGQISLQGVHRFTEPGLYPLVITATTPSGVVSVFEQMIPVSDGRYPEFQRINVGPELKDILDPNVMIPEFEKIRAAATIYSPVRQWQGIFAKPVQSNFVSTPFGIQRSYNGGALDNFHGGIDWGANGGAPITAPANGTVIFVSELRVRGRATLIDHGWGVVTGYWHQYKFHVTVGQKVKTGDLIGEVGSSGLSTGPHLHFEVWVGGNEVNPEQWLTTEFP